LRRRCSLDQPMASSHGFVSQMVAPKPSNATVQRRFVDDKSVADFSDSDSHNDDRDENAFPI
jgi:hypothetical protein